MSFNIKTFYSRIKFWSSNFKPLNNSANLFLWDLNDNVIRTRLILLSLCFSCCFLGLGYRLVSVAMHDSKAPRSFIKNNNFRKEVIDRNGKLLAVNLPSFSLFAIPKKVVNADESINRLASVIPNFDREKIRAELKSNKNFVWIKRDLTPKEQVEIFDLGLPGFDFEKEQKRVYPFGNLLSHILGYVGRDLVGLAGLEKSHNDFLSTKVNPLNKADQENSLELSIDVRLQTILGEEIDRVMQNFNAKGALGIIADPNNGEILAIVSRPDFDPHNPQLATPEQLFNMTSQGAYESGSVFKGLTMAIGFDTNATTMQDAYDITYMKVGKFQLRDYHPMKGFHTVPEIFLHSSNIGVSQIMLEVGKDNLKKYLKALGLLDQLQIELPERGSPLFPSDSRWNDLTTVTMSYGYALSITPLHFIQAMIPTINGGYKYPLTLMKHKKNKSVIGTKVFNENTSKEMRKLLRLVVQRGTGRKAEVPGYLVGGKTGTAEKLVNGKYVKNRRVSSFFGVMPASDPKYVTYIMFDDPKGTKESFGFATAGWTAAPAVGRVFERMISLYGLKPVDEENEEVKEIINVNYKVDEQI